MTCQIACSWLSTAKRLASMVALFSLGAIVPLLLARAPRGTTGMILEHRPFPVPVASPAPPPPSAPPASPRRIGCTLPLSQIGFMGDNYLHVRTPTGLQGIAASSSGCTIAVWGPYDLLVSRDDGATFSRLLPPGPADVWTTTPVVSVAISADETLYAVRGGRLEIEFRDGTRHERALPGATFDRIHTSGHWLIARSRDQLATSDDSGATWHLRAAPSSLTAAALRVDDAGLIHLAAATGPDDPIIYYIGYYIGDATGSWRKVWTSPPHRFYDPYRNPPGDAYYVSIHAFAFGADGRLYAERMDAHGNQIFAVSPAGDATISTELPDPSLLRGAPIAGTIEPWGARDAHGLMLSLYGGRGPIRTPETRLMTLVAQQQGAGRWLIGGVAP